VECETLVTEHERCDACDFDGARYDDAALLAALRALGPRWRELIAGAGADLRVRPEPKVWSAIEYAAHSRDITALHVFGVEQALMGEEPVFPAIMGDKLIDQVAATYLDSDPQAVVDALDGEARRLAQVAADGGSDKWERGLTIGDDRSTVRRLLEHALHDSLHHVEDVERGFAYLRAE
jgi:hypothetical protein